MIRKNVVVVGNGGLLAPHPKQKWKTPNIMRIHSHKNASSDVKQNASHKAGAASIPEAPLRAASIPNMFGHVVEAHTT